jgi:hypothetical protein
MWWVLGAPTFMIRGWEGDNEKAGIQQARRQQTTAEARKENKPTSKIKTQSRDSSALCVCLWFDLLALCQTLPKKEPVRDGKT